MTASQRTARRGASVYVAVMGVGMIVGVAALATSLEGRLLVRAQGDRSDRVAARVTAQSGVDFALDWINSHSDWRSRVVSGVDSASVSAGSGRFVWRVTDTDGDIADDPRDHATLRVAANSYGAAAISVLKVDIEPAGRALSCLDAAIHAATSIDVATGARVAGSGIASSGGDIRVNSGDLDLAAEAAGTIRGSDYNGGEESGAAPREVPGEHVFDWYVQRGTEIPYSSLLAFLGQSYFQTQEMSRKRSEFGAPNPLGIYWIDCGGQSPRLKWSRLLGTLVLLNAGPYTRIEGNVVFQADPLNYPVLMVQGDLRIDLNEPLVGQRLYEGLGQNYNPPGVPYEGVEDTDSSDNYPARLDGIVYVTGTATVPDHAAVRGNLIADSVALSSGKTLTIDYTPYASYYPPPGFSAGEGVRVLPGTYRTVSASEP